MLKQYHAGWVQLETGVVGEQLIWKNKQNQCCALHVGRIWGVGLPTINEYLILFSRSVYEVEN